jgi:uncharacterized protein (TIGR03437 family)
MSLSAGSLVSAFLALGCAGAFAQTININFPAQCPNGVQASGPCSTEFQFTSGEQNLSVSTSIGTVTLQGGVLLDDASFLPADESAVYGTRSGGGYAQTITITFPSPVTNFFVTVINGKQTTESYTVADNAGHSSSFSVPSNSSSGVQGVGFQTAGTTITVSSSDPDWDFFIGSLGFTAVSGNPSVSVSPAILNFSAQTNSSASLQQSIQVQNSGAGSVSFTASVVSGSPWVSVSPTSGSATLASPVIVTVTVNPQGLAAGGYRDVIHFSYPAESTACSPNATPQSCDVPVSLFVANPGPIISVSPTGAQFNVVQGAGSSTTQNITIANTGSAGTNVDYSVAPENGTGVPNGEFLLFGTTSGVAQPGNPGTLALSLNDVASALAPGVYYELVAISDQNSQNSPQYVTAVLNVVPAAASVLPQISPAGLLFVGQVGRPIVSQQVTVNWSAAQPQFFQATPLNAPGQSWLQSGTGGSVSASTPFTLTISVNAVGLSAGIYSGSVALTSAGSGAALGSVNVTLVLGAGGAANALSGLASQPTGARAAVRPQAAIAGCTPSTVVLTETGIPNNFSVPAGWPANLVTTMTDDCGNALEGGSVAANFSNGDPPLALIDQGVGGQYVASWQPSNVANTTITLNGTYATLKPGSTLLSGLVLSNQAPVLNQNGIVNNATYQSGAALAPAMVAAAFGANLSTLQTGVVPGVTPLPGQYQGTQLIVGGSVAPLYYVSAGQLDVEVPAELRPLQQYPAVGVVNGALSLPITVTVVPLAPAVLAYQNGSAIAEHLDFSLINSASPAHPGESIIIYLVGMGATTPPVGSGQVAPGSIVGQSLANATVQPVVQVAGQTAKILYAGLTPGSVGLYQIDLTIPTTVPAGNPSITVSQNTVDANTTTIPVVSP